MSSEQTKELSLSPSDFTDCSLLDSIDDDDQVFLLPIIRIAFPFLKSVMLEPLPHSYTAFSLLQRHNMMQAGESIMQIDNGYNLPVGEDAVVQHCGTESMSRRFTQIVTENVQNDQFLASSPVSGHPCKVQHVTDTVPYKFLGPAPACSHLRQQCTMHGVKSTPFQPQRISSQACELSNTEARSCKQEMLNAVPKSEPLNTFIVTKEKLCLSLGSTLNETGLQVNSASGMINLLAHTTTESSGLKQQVGLETSEGSPFHHGHLKRKRVSKLSATGSLMDFNSCFRHTALKRYDVRDDEASRATDTYEDPGGNIFLVSSDTKSVIPFSGENEQRSVEDQSLSHAEAECAQVVEKEITATGKGSSSELNECIIAKDHEKITSFKESSGRTRLGLEGGRDQPSLADVAGVLANVNDTLEEEPKLERCHRSNGKQWQCMNNATPGTLYCDIHHAYLSEYKVKQGKSSGLKPKPSIEKKEVKTSTAIKQMELQRCSDGCLRQTDVARCRRTDGKLWQCSKQVMPGSSYYCETHLNWRRGSRNKQKANSHVAGEPKQDETNASIRGISSEDGHVISTHEWEDKGSICSSQNSVVGVRVMQGGGHIVAQGRKVEPTVLEMSGGPIYTTPQTCGDGYHKRLPELVQTSQSDGLVTEERILDDIVLRMGKPEGKKSVNGFIQLGEVCCSEDACKALKEVPSIESWETSCSQDATSEGQGKLNTQARQCCRNDGKHWRCSQLCKPGLTYCEHHQGYAKRARARARARVDTPPKMEDSEKDYTHVKGFAPKLDNIGQASNHSPRPIISSAGPLYHKQCMPNEAEQLADMQDLCSLKRCQRKDGKGWQCSKHAKEGCSYCEHHLVYISKRNAAKLLKKEIRRLATRDDNGSATVYDPAYSSSPITTLCVLKQGMSVVDKPLLGIGVVNGLPCRNAGKADSPILLKEEMCAVGEKLSPGNAGHSSAQRGVQEVDVKPFEGSALYPPSALLSTHHSEDKPATTDFAAAAE